MDVRLRPVKIRHIFRARYLPFHDMSGASEQSLRAGMELRHDTLLRERAYIDGRWCPAAQGGTVEVRNPSTGVLLGTVPRCDTVQTSVAIEAAARAHEGWRRLLPQQRQEQMLAWHALILRHRGELAELLTLEQGKPLAESRGEIEYGASFVQWFAEEGKRTYGDTIPSHLPGRQLYSYRQPVGVAALVTPWNFPHAMLARKASAALAAGCTVVAYPSSYTPFSALALAELAQRAGLPAGVFNVVTGSSREIVGEMCRHPKVRALSFTGSTEVGRLLLGKCAPTVKRTCMELGGHAPFIAFPDCEVSALVDAALEAKFTTSGQDCLAANRICVHADIYAGFLARFTEKVRSLEVGDGFAPGVTIGPLQHARQVGKCEQHVADAVAKGARLLAGGSRHGAGALFFQPTVLADVTPNMDIWREETFGPVAAVTSFADEQEAVRLANDTEYGLAAYLFSGNQATCSRVAAALDYGMVAVNGVKMTGPPIPFGGIKQSGLGKEGSRHGIEEFMDLKYVCLAAGWA
jgi:aspartate-semialdehyde dehydrogenase